MAPSQQNVCSKCGQSFAADSDAAAGQEPRCPHCTEPAPPAPFRMDDGLSGYEVYNIVSDLATGVNVRWRDNVIQLAAIGVCLVLGAVIGALVVAEHLPGAITGGFIGLVAGLLGSGAFLMVFRFVRHMTGHHR